MTTTITETTMTSKFDNGKVDNRQTGFTFGFKSNKTLRKNLQVNVPKHIFISTECTAVDNVVARNQAKALAL